MSLYWTMIRAEVKRCIMFWEKRMTREAIGCRTTFSQAPFFSMWHKIIQITGSFDNSLGSSVDKSSGFLWVTETVSPKYVVSYSFRPLFGVGPSSAESWLSESVVVCSHFEGVVLMTIFALSQSSNLCPSEERHGVVVTIRRIEYCFRGELFLSLV